SARTFSAEAFVIATGTRWEAPAFPGIAPERVLTADGVQALATPPRSALVLGGDAAGTGFGLEYAALLAAAGSAVTVVTPDDRLVPGLDADVSSAAAALLGDLGISALCGWSVAGGDGDAVTVRRGEEQRHVDAEVVVAADVRRPYFGGLNLDAAGV